MKFLKVTLKSNDEPYSINPSDIVYFGMVSLPANREAKTKAMRFLRITIRANNADGSPGIFDVNETYAAVEKSLAAI